MINTKKAFRAVDGSIEKTSAELKLSESGTVVSVQSGTARIRGLPNAAMDEVLLFENGAKGLVQTLDKEGIGAVFLDKSDSVRAGGKVIRTGKTTEIPVGESLLGRVINPLGEPLDGGAPLNCAKYAKTEAPAVSVTDRAAVDTPLQTGIKAVDAFTPVGRGQRELILGDRQTGKTAVAVDTIINQRDSGVICIYCAIGQRNSAVLDVIGNLKRHDAMKNTVVVMAAADDEAGMRYIAPYAATAAGEYFMHKGEDVLIVYDDLTNHAGAYREMSLLLRRPPGREAFPGDIFYIHSRLLERATHLRAELGGGSLTALPVITTEAGNISAYIPTNVISITDGQIYLSAPMFHKGIMPAVDTGRSVSRVGGDAQLPAYKDVVGPLKLFYAQFEELESFTKFGTQLDEETKARIRRGRAVRQVLEQRQSELYTAAEQIAVFTAVNAGLFDGTDSAGNAAAQRKVIEVMHHGFKDLEEKINSRQKLSEEDTKRMTAAFAQALREEA